MNLYSFRVRRSQTSFDDLKLESILAVQFTRSENDFMCLLLAYGIGGPSHP